MNSYPNLNYNSFGPGFAPFTPFDAPPLNPLSGPGFGSYNAQPYNQTYSGQFNGNQTPLGQPYTGMPVLNNGPVIANPLPPESPGLSLSVEPLAAAPALLRPGAPVGSPALGSPVDHHCSFIRDEDVGNDVNRKSVGVQASPNDVIFVQPFQPLPHSVGVRPAHPFSQPNADLASVLNHRDIAMPQDTRRLMHQEVAYFTVGTTRYHDTITADQTHLLLEMVRCIAPFMTLLAPRVAANTAEVVAAEVAENVAGDFRVPPPTPAAIRLEMEFLHPFAATEPLWMPLDIVAAGVAWPDEFKHMDDPQLNSLVFPCVAPPGTRPSRYDKSVEAIYAAAIRALRNGPQTREQIADMIAFQRRRLSSALSPVLALGLMQEVQPAPTRGGGASALLATAVANARNVPQNIYVNYEEGENESDDESDIETQPARRGGRPKARQREPPSLMRLARCPRVEALTFHISRWVRFTVFTDGLYAYHLLRAHDLAATIFAATVPPTTRPGTTLAECVTPIWGFDEYSALQSKLLRTQLVERAESILDEDVETVLPPPLQALPVPAPADMRGSPLPYALAMRPPGPDRRRASPDVLYLYDHPPTDLFISLAALGTMAFCPMLPRGIAVPASEAVAEDLPARAPLTGDQAEVSRTLVAPATKPRSHPQQRPKAGAARAPTKRKLAARELAPARGLLLTQETGDRSTHGRPVRASRTAAVAALNAAEVSAGSQSPPTEELLGRREQEPTGRRRGRPRSVKPAEALPMEELWLGPIGTPPSYNSAHYSGSSSTPGVASNILGGGGLGLGSSLASTVQPMTPSFEMAAMPTMNSSLMFPAAPDRAMIGMTPVDYQDKFRQPYQNMSGVE